jgi:hypothetical protein
MGRVFYSLMEPDSTKESGSTTYHRIELKSLISKKLLYEKDIISSSDPL